MSFFKCSNSQLEKVHTSDFITTKIKGQAMISHKQNFEKEAFKVGFVLLKIKIIEKIKAENKTY